MKILHRDDLSRGGFAGIEETRVVTDSQLFTRKRPETSEGLGRFVYLADAEFMPLGETGMHRHKEIDVISVMIDGRVSHSGSLEHGKSLEAGDVQVQKAGGEGFSHNEKNPDPTKNRMIQLWALPEESGQLAAYKYYTPNQQGMTRIYGGSKTQTETFDSSITIDILRLKATDEIELPEETLCYVTQGQVVFNEFTDKYPASEGSLIRGNSLELQAMTDSQIIIISQFPK